nr:hypothetical protein [uncultured Arsenicibacter sp.]
MHKGTEFYADSGALSEQDVFFDASFLTGLQDVQNAVSGDTTQRGSLTLVSPLLFVRNRQPASPPASEAAGIRTIKQPV